MNNYNHILYNPCFPCHKTVRVPEGTFLKLATLLFIKMNKRFGQNKTGKVY